MGVQAEGMACPQVLKQSVLGSFSQSQKLSGVTTRLPGEDRVREAGEITA